MILDKVSDIGLYWFIVLKCGENIEKLASAPSFYHTVCPQIGYGWGLNITPTIAASSMILDTSYNLTMV